MKSDDKLMKDLLNWHKFPTEKNVHKCESDSKYNPQKFKKKTFFFFLPSKKKVNFKLW